MEQYLFALGQSGAKSLEGLIYALSGDVLVLPGTLDITLVDTDMESATVKRCAELVKAYMALESRELPQGEKGFGFSTKVDFAKYPQHVDEKISLDSFLSSTDEKAMCHCFMGDDEISRDIRKGFGGNDAAAEIFYSSLLSSLHGDDLLLEKIRHIRSSLDSGGDLQLVFIGSTTGATSGVLLQILPEWIRRKLAGADMSRLVMDAVCILPHYSNPDEDAASHRLGEVLLSGYSHVYMAGLPKSRRSRNMQLGNRLCDGIGMLMTAQSLIDPFCPEKLLTFALPDGEPKWENLGEFASSARKGFGGMYKCGMLMMRWVLPACENGGKAGKKGSKTEGWYNAYFRDSLYAKTSLDNDCAACRKLFTGFFSYIRDIQQSLPPQIRFSKEMTDGMDVFRSCYVEMLDKWGELALMRRKARESGMSDENVVHRYSMENNDAEEMRDNISALQDSVIELDAKQSAWRRQIGGEAAHDIIKEIAEQRKSVVCKLKSEEKTAIQRIDKAEEIISDDEKYKIAAARSKLRFMQDHIFREESALEKVTGDISSQEKQNLMDMPPEIGANKAPDDIGDNLMVNLELLQLWDEADIAGDQKEQYRLASLIWEEWSSCIYMSDGSGCENGIQAGQLVGILSRDKWEKPSLKVLMRRIMELSMAEKKE